jgi:hypothetical protein
MNRPPVHTAGRPEELTARQRVGLRWYVDPPSERRADAAPCKSVREALLDREFITSRFDHATLTQRGEQRACEAGMLVGATGTCQTGSDGGALTCGPIPNGGAR